MHAWLQADLDAVQRKHTQGRVCLQIGCEQGAKVVDRAAADCCQKLRHQALCFLPVVHVSSHAPSNLLSNRLVGMCVELNPSFSHI